MPLGDCVLRLDRAVVAAERRGRPRQGRGGRHVGGGDDGEPRGLRRCRCLCSRGRGRGRPHGRQQVRAPAVKAAAVARLLYVAFRAATRAVSCSGAPSRPPLRVRGTHRFSVGSVDGRGTRSPAEGACAAKAAAAFGAPCALACRRVHCSIDTHGPMSVGGVRFQAARSILSAVQWAPRSRTRRWTGPAGTGAT